MASVPNTPLLGDRPFDSGMRPGSFCGIDRRYLYGGVAAAIVICFFTLNPFREVGPGSRGVLMTFSSQDTRTDEGFSLHVNTVSEPHQTDPRG
jgi:hypothetical protein